MQIKNVSMMFVAGFALAMLTGCGVPKEEHLAALAEKEIQLETVKEELNAKISDLEASLKSEETKALSVQGKLKQAGDQIKELQQEKDTLSEAIATSKKMVADLQTDLSSSQAAVSAAKKAMETLKAKYAELEEVSAELKRRLNMVITNMGTGGAEIVEEELDGGEAAAEVPPNAGKVKGLLDAMGDM